MKKILHWLDENLEEFILVIFLIAMTLIMGIQIFCMFLECPCPGPKNLPDISSSGVDS